MSRYDATITVDASEKTHAIYESISVDESFYPENPVKSKIIMDDDGQMLTIRSESDNLAHLRANLNSTLRLIQAGNNSIESVKI